MKPVALLIALAALTALAQSSGSIYIYDEGVQKGRPTGLNFTGDGVTAVCINDGGFNQRCNITITGSDGGTSSSGPTPTGLCGDGGSALGWDGGAYYCAATVNAGTCSAGQYVSAVSTTGAPTCGTPPGTAVVPAWHTVRSIDFNAHGTTSLDAGVGTYTLAGLNCWKTNTAANTAADVVSGTGLRFRPLSASDLWTTTATAPMIRCALPTLVSGLTPEMPLRFSIYFSGNLSANYDQVNIGVWVEGAVVNTWLKAGTAWGTVTPTWTTSATNEAAMSRGVDRGATPDVLVMMMPLGVTGEVDTVMSGAYSAGFPASTALFPAGTIVRASSSSSWASPTAGLGLAGYSFFIAAIRATSATALTVSVKSLLIEAYY